MQNKDKNKSTKYDYKQSIQTKRYQKYYQSNPTTQRVMQNSNLITEIQSAKNSIDFQKIGNILSMHTPLSQSQQNSQKKFIFNSQNNSKERQQKPHNNDILTHFTKFQKQESLHKKSNEKSPVYSLNNSMNFQNLYKQVLQQKSKQDENMFMDQKKIKQQCQTQIYNTLQTESDTKLDQLLNFSKENITSKLKSGYFQNPNRQLVNQANKNIQNHQKTSSFHQQQQIKQKINRNRINTEKNDTKTRLSKTLGLKTNCSQISNSYQINISNEKNFKPIYSPPSNINKGVNQRKNTDPGTNSYAEKLLKNHIDTSQNQAVSDQLQKYYDTSSYDNINNITCIYINNVNSTLDSQSHIKNQHIKKHQSSHHSPLNLNNPDSKEHCHSQCTGPKTVILNKKLKEILSIQFLKKNRPMRPDQQGNLNYIQEPYPSKPIKMQEKPLEIVKNTEQIKGWEELEKVEGGMDMGLKIEDIEIGKCLGKGRFGNVYMVRDKNTNLICAMKVISKQVLKESNMETQILQEIKIQSFVNHPNILRMYGMFHDKQRIFLLLELASHGDLMRELKQQPQQRYSEAIAAYYVKQICEALVYLHSLGVIHRDIKPENIMINYGILKLSDFGWSIYTKQERNTFCGTLDYVSPEVIQGKTYDFKIDVWSIGVLTYELLTGKQRTKIQYIQGQAPFDTKKQYEAYENIVHMKMEFPSYISAEARHFISKFLVKDPSKRISIEDALSHNWIVKYNKRIQQQLNKNSDVIQTAFKLTN